ncbi:Piwi domain protein [bacterium]|nr:Piwi domain protein [bacterium]
METNIYPIEIEFEEYQISRLQYSEEKLKELREQHNNTHSFFRNGDYIYISNMDGDDSVRLGETFTASTYSDDKITASLIKHIFFRTFKERFSHIVPVSFYPFRIYSTRESDDLVRALLPDHLKDVISYKKLIEIQLRLLEKDGQPYFGLVIRTNRKWLLNKNCKELRQEGFDLIGCEVLHSEHLLGLEGILAPNEEFIGKIKSVTGGLAVVATNFGDQTIPLIELSLIKTTGNIKAYLTFATTEQECDRIFSEIEKGKAEYLNPKKEFKEIASIARMLSTGRGSDNQLLHLNKDGFCFKISTTPLSSQQSSFELKTPTFVFDPAANRTEAIYPDRGLSNFGPYDSLNFDTKSPNVLAICAKDNRGSFSTFMANLVDGLPNSKYFKKGLKKKYDLNDIHLEIREVNSTTYEEYNSIVSDIDRKPDMAIIEIPGNFKKLPDNQNPYYRLKAQLLTLEIPVQFVLQEKVRNHDEYLLNSIALQIYAKLGGTPWVLTSSQSVDREIIIGIGHSVIRSNAFSGNEQSRVVGISTFFSSDGQYLLSNKAKEVPYEEYFEELLTNLKDSFARLQEVQGWKDGDTIRLIFHIFKPIKNVEFDVVSELIRQYSQYRIQFAFVTISKKHPYMLFDSSQTGTQGYRRHIKGQFVPQRKSNLILDSSTCLVQMLGPQQIKTNRHGASAPILIRIRLPQGNYNAESIEELLFTDIQYITQQIYSFSYLSWRGFLPGETPATMLYSDLISQLLGKLRKIEGWQANVLNFNLKRKKWFL